MSYFSFVMVCYNNWNFTKIAVESFFESLNPLLKAKGIEFVLVNNGSSDETAAGIEEYKLKYREAVEIIAINLEQNLGYVVGANTGLSRCRGEIITILNNDLVFCPGWFDGLIEHLEKDPKIGITAPLITNGSGRENIILKFASSELEQSFYKSKSTMNFYAKEIMKKNDKLVLYETRIVGACIALKREVLDLVGGLDFWFGIGIFDDDDFSLRVNIAGYKTAIIGSSFIYHIGNATFSKIRTVSNAAVLSNKMKFIHKWKLRCMENIQGLYNSRQKIIENTSYNREKHYVPLSLEQFNTLSELKINKKSGPGTFLLVADWTNLKSKWLQRLESLIPQLGKEEEISLWMPEMYFTQKEIEERVTKIFELIKPETQENHPVIKVIDKNIEAVEILALLNSYDAVLSVEDDFVNRYITYLAGQIGVSVE
jgi:Predicted glycosyltransferases